MHIVPEIRGTDFTDVFGRFLAITGIEPWERRIDSIRQQLNQNRFLEPFLMERHAELAFFHLMESRARTGELPLTIVGSGQYQPYAFITTLASTYDRLNTVGQVYLRGRLLKGLGDNDGLLSLQHEISTAAALMLQGFDVDFWDMESRGRFDFLPHRAGTEIEVECKMVSGDLGRKIHPRKMVELCR
jgi:hypothetical protein